MGSITLEVLILLLLIILNGFLAMSELAVVSARRPRLQQLADAGDRRAQIALETASAPGEFLSTVQIGITLVGIFAGAFGGATVARWLATYVALVPGIGGSAEPISVALVVVVITYLSLVIGELTPKHLALRDAEQVALRVAPLFRRLTETAAPVVRLLDRSTEVVLRLLRVPAASEPTITEEEVRLMLAQATQQGIFEPQEQEIVGQVFRLADRRVDVLMVPRTEMIWLDLNASPQEVLEQVVAGGRSRYPVAEGRPDRVVGIVLAKDILAQHVRGETPNLRTIMRPALFIPSNLPALRLVERFKQTHSKMAVVIDEYGGVEGLVTVDDILGELVGDIPEPGETIEPPLVQRPDGSWLVDGLFPIDELRERFDVAEVPGDAEEYYSTLGGLVMAKLGRVPMSGDAVEWAGYRLEVVDMDGRRVDKVLLTPVAARDTEARG